jgi:glycosidase
MIYSVWMRAFTPEVTIKAVTARLPYIADLGANIVYLSPLNPGWNPYGADDYDAIDPRYGTEADLKELTATAHKLGLKVIMDVAFSSTGGPNNPLLKKPGFFKTTEDGRLELSWWNWPIPDFASPQVREYFVANLLHWVRDVKADGFRCDLAAGIPLGFWEQARRALDKVNPEAILLAESDRPDDQLRAFDLNYNYYYYTTLTSVLQGGETAARIPDQWAKTRATYPHGARLVHFSDNVNELTRAVLKFGTRGALAASVLNFTLDGVPFLYNGQEVADSTVTPWYESKAISFPGTGGEGKLDPRIADLMRAMGMKDDRVVTLATYKRLLQLRKEEAALTSGELFWIANTAPESVLSFVRKRGAEEVVVIVNLSNRILAGSMDLPAAEYVRLKQVFGDGGLTSEVERLDVGRVGFRLPAYGTIVAKRQPALTK